MSDKKGKHFLITYFKQGAPDLRVVIPSCTADEHDEFFRLSSACCLVMYSCRRLFWHTLRNYQMIFINTIWKNAEVYFQILYVSISIIKCSH